MERRFYVYEHIRPDTGEVFYVGKGAGVRAYCINRPENKHYQFIVAKLARLGLDVAVRWVAEGLSELAAFELERSLIKKHGRSDLFLGPLANQTDGGDGSQGAVVSAATRALLSKQRRGIPKSPEHRAKLAEHCRALGKTKEARDRLAKRNKTFRWGKGAPKSAEHRKRIGDAQRGISKSAEHRANMSAARTGRKFDESYAQSRRAAWRRMTAENRAIALRMLAAGRELRWS